MNEMMPPPDLSRPGMNRKCQVGMDLDASAATVLHPHTHSNDQAHALPDTIPKRAQLSRETARLNALISPHVYCYYFYY